MLDAEGHRSGCRRAAGLFSAGATLGQSVTAGERMQRTVSQIARLTTEPRRLICCA
jgi:hypothetical protein